MNSRKSNRNSLAFNNNSSRREFLKNAAMVSVSTLALNSNKSEAKDDAETKKYHGKIDKSRLPRDISKNISSDNIYRSLLSETGVLSGNIDQRQIEQWKNLLKKKNITAENSAHITILIGEWEMAHELEQKKVLFDLKKLWI